MTRRTGEVTGEDLREHERTVLRIAQESPEGIYAYGLAEVFELSQVQDGMLYKLLGRLTSWGLLERYPENLEVPHPRMGPVRKLHSITELGQKVLGEVTRVET